MTSEGEPEKSLFELEPYNEDVESSVMVTVVDMGKRGDPVHETRIRATIRDCDNRVTLRFPLTPEGFEKLGALKAAIKDIENKMKKHHTRAMQKKYEK